MKTSLLINLIFTLLFVFSSNAFEIIVSQDDMNYYNGLKNIHKDINFTSDRIELDNGVVKKVENRTLDVFYNKAAIGKGRPVVIHFYGCSWINGNKINYSRIGSFIQEKGYVAVIPDYIMYPNGKMEHMVDDVYDAIMWTKKNIYRYGGDPNNIIITAHSSGAHLVALTLVKAALKIKNNGHTLDLPKFIKKVVLLNGPYMIDSEFISYTMGSSENGESNFNVAPEGNAKIEYQALLSQLITEYFSNEEKPVQISPTQLLRRNNNTIDFATDKFTFFYTELDDVVPESSSKNLITEIFRTSHCSCNYIYEKNYSHDEIINGVNSKDEDNIYKSKFLS